MPGSDSLQKGRLQAPGGRVLRRGAVDARQRCLGLLPPIGEPRTGGDPGVLFRPPDTWYNAPAGDRLRVTWCSTAAGLACSPAGMLTRMRLSFTLFSGDRELLVDPGTFVYNCAPEWRNYFRSTRAHNTVAIDGRDQAEQGGTFHWKTRIGSRAAREQLPHLVSSMRKANTMGTGGCRKESSIAGASCMSPRNRGSSWMISADAGEHTFDFHYHFAGRRGIESTARSGTTGHGACYAVAPACSADLAVKTERIGGWVARIWREASPLHPARHSYRTGAGRGDDFLVLTPDGDREPVIRTADAEKRHRDRLLLRAPWIRGHRRPFHRRFRDGGRETFACAASSSGCGWKAAC